MRRQRDTRSENLLYALSVRYERWRREHSGPVAGREPRTRAVLFGAGSAASTLLHSMIFDPRSRFEPVGVLDDDPERQGERLAGIAVVGTRADLAAVVERTRAAAVIFTIGNAEGSLVREIRARALAAGVRFLVVPETSEVLDHELGALDIREVRITDLVGRHRITIDPEAVGGILSGKRVLVTGAGGEIGSELCRQIHRFEPAELIMVDHDERALQAVLLSVDPRGEMHDPSVVLADVRDAGRVREIFRTREPEVVFHAAALQHQPLLERHPDEAVKTNVLGTLAVLEAAENVDLFVNVSTAKAADPVGVLGYTKRIAERLTASFAGRRDGTFVSVRFGNVVGRSGSLLATFAAQIADGGPVTVTHPEATRYLTTTQEAVQLVIQAAAIGRSGEALVVKPGDPVRIAEVARDMVDLSGEPVDIVFSGLRPGEKLGETLFGADEADRRPHHPLIAQVPVPPLDPSRVRDLAANDLAELCAPPSFESRAA
ncbi:polysaccharide biosynthesis protein [Actinoplanes sp. TRM 88003]|uniref:Polysaccharide biosynthesis protein n=1 Tax=Paractinoplanes aksuensis TaxID=2939490 RepID=A0ABT1DY96_9ACTN|nr:polysaccharide biosynthesis protein [Actinoplanes aksuensis]MCO8275852.1 polysaccharide biosynthesis protein [Actinoplanes aksuensis]